MQILQKVCLTPLIIAMAGLLLAQGVVRSTSIEGTVLDPNLMGITGVTIILFSSDSTFLDGTVSDTVGHFSLARHEDAVNMVFSSIEFRDTALRLDKLRPGPLQIQLKASSHTLSEISVVGKKPLLEQKSDRLIMNLSASHSTAGSSVLQLLGRVPGVVVDQQNGQISLTGKAGVLVMINNRISRVPAQMLLNQLEAMKAENVDRIEVIHQPPAKYESSGSGGIIHLVLKDDDRKGINGNASVMAGYGQLSKFGGNFLLNYRFDKLNLYSDYGFSLNENDEFTFDGQRKYVYQGVNYSYNSETEFPFQRKRTHTLRLGLDWEIDDQNTFGFLAGIGDFYHHGTLISQSVSKIEGMVDHQLGFKLLPSVINKYVFLNANFYRRMDHSTINLDVDHARYNLSSPGTFHQTFGHRPGVPSDFRVDRTTPLTLWTFKADFAQELLNKGKIEYGVKASLSDLDNTAIIDEKVNDIWQENTLFSQRNEISENIYAAYTSFVPSLGPRTDFEIGLRYEHFDYLVESQRDGEGFAQKRGALFPVVRLNFRMDSINQFQIAYNRRVSRPAYSQLASYFVFLDPTRVATGNPLLRPAFIQALKLSYTHKSIYLSLEGTRSKNYITYYNTVDKPRHIQLSTQHNFSRFDLASATISIPAHFTSWWDLHLTLIGQYRHTYDENRESPFERDKTNLIIQANQILRISKTISTDIQFSSVRNVLDGDQVKFDLLSLNVGLQKKFPSGNTVTVAANDLLNRSLRIPWEYQQPELDIHTSGFNQVSERQVRITYAFSFGNKKIAKHRQRKTGSEEERNRVKN